MKMVRINVYVTKNQYDMMSSIREGGGPTMADQIRRVLDQHIKQEDQVCLDG